MPQPLRLSTGSAKSFERDPFHIEGLRLAGQAVPEPTAIVDSVETA